MALTPTQEAQVLQLVAQQAALLSLAGNEATITSKLGATKVTLPDLPAASSLGDTDLLLIRQGVTDKSITGSLVKQGSQTFIQDGTGSIVRSMNDKAKERVSVKDFAGVDPTGVTNSLAGIQNALNAGKVIDFGSAADTYRIEGTLTLNDGHILLVNGASLQQYNVQAPLFNASGKKDITIENGIFIGLLEPTFVNSPSSQAICIKADNAQNLNVSNNRFTNFCYSPLMVGSGGVDISFRNNKVVGPGAAYLNDANYRNCTGATITGTQIEISGNKISGTCQGIIVGQGSVDISVYGNLIHNLVNEHGVYADTGLTNLSICGNTIRNTGVTGVGIKVQLYDAYGVSSEGISISGNTIQNTGSDGISVLNTSGPSLYLTSVSITGNSIFNAGQYGINVRYCRSATVSGNTIDTALYGVFVATCQMLNVSGNTVRETQKSGIYDDGLSSDVAYMNNVIIRAGLAGVDANGESSGIFIGGCQEHNVIGNFVRGEPTKTQYCLYATGAGGATLSVRGNIFVGAKDLGARFPGGAIRYIGENKFSGQINQDAAFATPETLQRGSEEHTYYGTAAPASGFWSQGTKVISRYPAAGGHVGWVCVAAGTPGTWKTFGPVTP